MRARDNPFRTECVLRVRYRLQGLTWDQLMRRLAALGYRAAVVGPEGAGKTTLLEDIAPRLGAAGFTVKFLRLDDSKPAFARDDLERFLGNLSESDVILFDGADLMGPLAWLGFRRRTRRAAGLVVAAQRPGRLPTVLRCSTSPELLAALVEEILGPEAAALRPVTDELFRRHRGNLREALRALYDLYAAR